MSELYLVTPSIKYEESIIEFVNDYIKNNISLVNTNNLKNYVQYGELNSWIKNNKKNTYFIILNNEVIGIIYLNNNKIKYSIKPSAREKEIDIISLVTKYIKNKSTSIVFECDKDCLTHSMQNRLSSKVLSEIYDDNYECIISDFELENQTHKEGLLTRIFNFQI